MNKPIALSISIMVGEVLIPGVLEAGAIQGTDGCARAAALADAI